MGSPIALLVGFVALAVVAGAVNVVRFRRVARRMPAIPVVPDGPLPLDELQQRAARLGFEPVGAWVVEVGGQHLLMGLSWRAADHTMLEIALPALAGGQGGRPLYSAVTLFADRRIVLETKSIAFPGLDGRWIVTRVASDQLEEVVTAHDEAITEQRLRGLGVSRATSIEMLGFYEWEVAQLHGTADRLAVRALVPWGPSPARRGGAGEPLTWPPARALTVDRAPIPFTALRGQHPPAPGRLGRIAPLLVAIGVLLGASIALAGGGSGRQATVATPAGEVPVTCEDGRAVDLPTPEGDAACERATRARVVGLGAGLVLAAAPAALGVAVMRREARRRDRFALDRLTAELGLPPPLELIATR